LELVKVRLYSKMGFWLGMHGTSVCDVEVYTKDRVKK
jgi:hypothetical protein